MSEPFLGEVKIWGLNFAPREWMFCNGGTLSIQQYSALFSLLGTQFGGNGTSTFQVPDLRGRVPMHPGGSIQQQGEAGGQQTVTLSESQMPQHSHGVTAVSATGGTNQPANHVFAGADGASTYASPGNLVSLSAISVPNVGGSQAHENRQPTIALTFTIALQGIYPARN